MVFEVEIANYKICFVNVEVEKAIKKSKLPLCMTLPTMIFSYSQTRIPSL